MFSLASFDRPFVGLRELPRRARRSPESMPILRNTVIFVVRRSPASSSSASRSRCSSSSTFPAPRYLRGLFLVAWVMPALVVGAIWSWILAGDFGVLNYILMSLGIIDGEHLLALRPGLFALRGDHRQHLARRAVQHAAALGRPRRHPDDLYEAAELDGANAWQRFWTITLPMMRSHDRRGDLARPHLHAAAVRPFRGDDPGRADQLLERVRSTGPGSCRSRHYDFGHGSDDLGADDRLRDARLGRSTSARPVMRYADETRR